MQKFDKLTGVAAPLNILNIDTDMIIPKQFLKTIKRSGLGKNLFDEMRYDATGGEKADFVLNQGPYRHAEILVAGDKFWLWIKPRACAMGASRFRNSLCDLDQLCRYFL